PLLLGYANEAVDRAAAAQAARGALLSLNHPLHLDFIERLVARFPGAEMGVWFKTGSEATTAALRVARRHTGRRKVARAGYHGWHDWCLPLEDSVPAGLAEQVPEFDARDPGTLAAVLEANPGQIAAVIVAPEMVLPLRRETLGAIGALARHHGAVFVLDEVKTAFRTEGGSIQAMLDLVPPDLTTVSKALGNGWPIAALVGRREVMQSGAGLHYSATFHGDTAAMAAAMAVLDVLDREDVAGHLRRLGERLIEGLNDAARAAGVPVEAYGEPVPAMPFLRFAHPDAATNERVKEAFYAAMCDRGVLLHPRHMWFLSYAHGDADVARALAAAGEAMAIAARLV
ncbi:MAG TPA: aminotransferase class III-fold pyridoxal phosphate-dependent enzyme, partial [Polyangiaceae bacterium]|nr:aminotransferase class III-fold pyridoxal phosphate-dependent enzyme [Polyangiaceae bacterium]